MEFVEMVYRVIKILIVLLLIMMVYLGSMYYTQRGVSKISRNYTKTINSSISSMSFKGTAMGNYYDEVKQKIDLCPGDIKTNLINVDKIGISINYIVSVVKVGSDCSVDEIRPIIKDKDGKVLFNNKMNFNGNAITIKIPIDMKDKNVVVRVTFYPYITSDASGNYLHVSTGVNYIVESK